MIIVFANQKGGVGKTTLCMLFANYLAKKNVNVLVLDVDRQRSISSQRHSDAAAYTEQEELYLVEECDVENVKEVKKMMEAAKNVDGVVLIDTPGNVTEDGLIPIFLSADAIVCPYQYEQRCLESTGVFIQVLRKLGQNSGKTSNVMFVPNHVDSRIGTLEERSFWEKTDEIFNSIGNVLPIIPYKSGIMRCNTYTITDAQEKDVENCFNAIIKKLDIK